MNKKELREWNDAVLSVQALSFLEPFGLTMRFDADVFDEDKRLDTDCIALYKGGRAFEGDVLGLVRSVPILHAVSLTNRNYRPNKIQLKL